MFRKKRNISKSGYNIWHLKENGKLLYDLDRVWQAIYSAGGLHWLDVLNGPTILVDSVSVDPSNYYFGLNTFRCYASEHLSMAIALPTKYNLDNMVLNV